MKKLNNKGFIGPLELVAIALVVGLLGFAVYRLTLTESKPETPGSQSEQVQETTQNSEEKEKTEEAEETTSYMSSENDLKFAYPADWKFIKNETNEAGRLVDVQLASSDYVEQESSDYLFVQEGYLLEVIVSNSNGGNLDDTDFELAAQNTNGDYEFITIDGNDAVISNIHSHGVYIEAQTYANNKLYTFRLHTTNDELNSPARQQLDKIVQTIKL